MTFISDRFDLLSNSYLAGYYRYTKKDTVYGATDDDGIDRDISQYGMNCILSGSGDPAYAPQMYTSGVNQRCNVTLTDPGDGMTVDIFANLSSSDVPRCLVEFNPYSASFGAGGWGSPWGYPWGYGYIVGDGVPSLYGAYLDDGFVTFVYNEEIVQTINLPADDPTSAVDYSLHWSMRVAPAQHVAVYDSALTGTFLRHEMMMINHSTNAVSHSFTMTDAPASSGPGKFQYMGSTIPPSGRPQVEAVRVSNEYHSQIEHYYDYVSGAINDTNPGEGEYDYDRFLIPDELANPGEYFGPVPASTMLYVDNAYRKLISPFHFYPLNPSEHSWTSNFTKATNKLVFNMEGQGFAEGAGSTNYRSHRGWNQRVKLPVNAPISHMHMRVYAEVPSGTLYLRFGTRTGMPFQNEDLIGEDAIYYATGTLSEDGMVHGIMPIAKNYDSTCLYVALSGSLSNAPTFTIKGFSAVPVLLTGSNGIGGIGGIG